MTDELIGHGLGVYELTTVGRDWDLKMGMIKIGCLGGFPYTVHCQLGTQTGMTIFRIWVNDGLLRLMYEQYIRDGLRGGRRDARQ